MTINKFLLFLILSSTIISCDSSKNIKLRAEIMTKFSQDITNVLDLAINSVTLGQGAKVVDLIISEEGKQKMIKENLLPFISSELEKIKDTKKLEDLNTNQLKRYAFAIESLTNNSENIKKKLSGITAKLFDGIIYVFGNKNK